MKLGRHCRIPHDLESVTDRDHGREVSPDRVGLSRRDVDAIWAKTEALYRTGTQPAIALCVRKRGEVVIERAIGHLAGNGPDDREDTPKVPIRASSPFCIFSVSKAVTAMVVHLLDDRGLLHIDDPVAEYLPEFGTHGKDRVTIRHVLTHRAGIPSVAGQHNDPELLLDWDRVVALLCDARPTFPPGRRLAYHAVTGGFVLGEIVRRVTGRDLRDVLRDEIAKPLGFRHFSYGVAPERVREVARNEFTGPPVPPGIHLLVQRALGVPFAEAVRISNDARYLTGVVPSGNVVATAYEVATFFDLLRNGGELGGARIFDRRTVRRALIETSYLELDLTLAFPVRYGLGLMLGAPRLSLFGPRTASAFGHLGFINVLGWADPERELSVALLTSGKPFVGPHLVRLVDLVRTITLRGA
ncbi:serine hydrolase domain-containing protein [Sandaracinus amylolyticus]|uniref:serine hydrolase domain-containing protein n=1 Tax=Sandaracinus amylolyticus TaxID=927083 RepID=UPI001F400E35|nr:serine hydrolase domain-containing protein [Sandaracinus amylolyticus]UJR79697.1 Penicillin-binding protein, beta-lactamase class C [Sandaracinus amylolyticus]